MVSMRSDKPICASPLSQKRLCINIKDEKDFTLLSSAY